MCQNNLLINMLPILVQISRNKTQIVNVFVKLGRILCVLKYTSNIVKSCSFFKTIYKSSINSSIPDNPQIISRISSFTKIIIKDQLAMFFFVAFALKFSIYNLLCITLILFHSCTFIRCIILIFNTNLAEKHTTTIFIMPLSFTVYTIPWEIIINKLLIMLNNFA
ncbi:hypothetical protein H5410_032879 [Solanum commersonii]|uniref:Uncharacterized protein n=1 Tax=Solanum commersonii TaxID=4109 RepID=A0A9J5YNI6_SOLCO|nr:hypothetical protein H5410_032879 [Solanum commersonii]